MAFWKSGTSQPVPAYSSAEEEPVLGEAQSSSAKKLDFASTRI